MNGFSLKPFKKESDVYRKFDILRAVIFFLALEKSEALPKNVLISCRKKTSEIHKLRKKFPVISWESLKNIADHFGVEFVFWFFSKPLSLKTVVGRSGSSDRKINLQISQCQDFEKISLYKLSFLVKIDLNPKPCFFFKSKIILFPSFLAAIRCLELREIFLGKFHEFWGTFRVKFQEEKKFSNLFGFGFSIWCSETFRNRVRASKKPRLHILLNKKDFEKGHFSALDPITIAIEPKIKKYFECFICCKKRFRTKKNLKSHEIKCRKLKIFSKDENFCPSILKKLSSK